MSEKLTDEQLKEIRIAVDELTRLVNRDDLPKILSVIPDLLDEIDRLRGGAPNTSVEAPKMAMVMHGGGQLDPKEKR